MKTLEILEDNIDIKNDAFLKESYLHVLGSLHENVALSLKLQASLESLLKLSVFGELFAKNHPILRARAIWVYGKLGSLPGAFNSPAGQEQLSDVLDGIY